MSEQPKDYVNVNEQNDLLLDQLLLLQKINSKLNFFAIVLVILFIVQIFKWLVS